MTVERSKRRFLIAIVFITKCFKNLLHVCLDFFKPMSSIHDYPTRHDQSLKESLFIKSIRTTQYGIRSLHYYFKHKLFIQHCIPSDKFSYLVHYFHISYLGVPNSSQSTLYKNCLFSIYPFSLSLYFLITIVNISLALFIIFYM